MMMTDGVRKNVSTLQAPQAFLPRKASQTLSASASRPFDNPGFTFTGPSPSHSKVSLSEYKRLCTLPTKNDYAVTFAARLLEGCSILQAQSASMAVFAIRELKLKVKHFPHSDLH